MKRSFRFSIAGLMSVVVIASLTLAALRSGSSWWASATYLATRGVLALGLVGVFCGRADERAWWLGFTLFGWSYRIWVFGTWVNWLVTYPSVTTGQWVCSSKSLEQLAGMLGAQLPRDPNYQVGGFGLEYDVASFGYIVDCLTSLSFAVLGGCFARFLFPSFVAPRSAQNEARPAKPVLEKGWYRPLLVGLCGLLVYAFVAVIGSRTAPGLWAGATIMMAWGVLGLLAVGVVFQRGGSRVRCLGAAVFGIGYLMLVSGHSDELSWPQYATNAFLDSIRPHVSWVPIERPSTSSTVAVTNFRIMKALDQHVPIDFPNDTPLEDVLDYIRFATRAPDGREIPIFVDPIGLQEAEKTIQSPVSINIQGVPLRKSLGMILRQIGMMYEVREGLLTITSESCRDGYHEPAYTDPFLLTGQCLLALVAAGLGSILAPLVAKTGRVAAEEPQGQ